MQFDSGILVNNSSADIPVYLVKFSADGAYRWIKTFPRPVAPLSAFDNSAVISAVAVTAQDEIVLAGQLTGTVDLNFAGGAPLVGTATPAVFAAAYGADGAYRWAHAYTSSGVARATSIQAAPDRSLKLIGEFPGTGAFGTSTSTPQSFLAHLDPNGAIAAPAGWVRTFLPTDGLVNIAIADDGSIFESTRTALVRRDGSSGQTMWSIPNPGWTARWLSPIAGGVVVGGDYANPIDFDPGPAEDLHGLGGDFPSAAFMAAFGRDDHQLLWVREPPTFFNQAFTTDAAGTIFVVQTSRGSRDLDPGPLTDIQSPFSPNDAGHHPRQAAGQGARRARADLAGHDQPAHQGADRKLRLRQRGAHEPRLRARDGHGPRDYEMLHAGKDRVRLPGRAHTFSDKRALDAITLPTGLGPRSTRFAPLPVMRGEEVKGRARSAPC